MTEHLAHPGNPNVSQDGISSPRNPLGQAFESAKNAVYGAAVAYEMLPIDEATKGAAFAVTQGAFDKPIVTAAAVGLTTFAIEASSAVATANLLGTKSGEKFTTSIHKLMGKVGLSGLRTNAGTETAIAFATGVPLTLALKQQQDPSRTPKQNRKYGVALAGGVSSAMAGMTYLAAEGVSAVESVPEKIGVGVLALAGIALVASKVKERITHKKPIAIQNSEALAVEKSAPNYELSPDQMEILQKGIVKKAREVGGKGISAVWISPDSEYANYIRTKESEVFETQHIPELFARYEDESAFLAIVDTRKGNGKVVRGSRITSPQFNENVQSANSEIRMAMIQDMVASGQITDVQLRNYYTSIGVDVEKCISIETNFRIGERASRRFGLVPISQLAYLAMYNRVVRHDHNARDVAIFAHINKASQDSLEHFGVDIKPLAGRTDLHTPATEGKFDDDFTPVAFMNTPYTQKAMRRASIAAPKEVQL